MSEPYVFTPDEKKWVAVVRDEYERRLLTIIQIHQLQGNFDPTPDGLVPSKDQTPKKSNEDKPNQ